jgi:hypothetical protein
VIETYTDGQSYNENNGELIWDRTLGRPRNIAILPSGWYLTAVSVPAVISLDEDGRVVCDEIHLVLKARQSSPKS